MDRSQQPNSTSNLLLSENQDRCRRPSIVGPHGGIIRQHPIQQVLFIDDIQPINFIGEHEDKNHIWEQPLAYIASED